MIALIGPPIVSSVLLIPGVALAIIAFVIVRRQANAGRAAAQWWMPVFGFDPLDPAALPSVLASPDSGAARARHAPATDFIA